MMATSAPAITFFGTWAGPLPAVTELHFRSFLRHHLGSRYELWLDEDDAGTAIPPALQWLQAHPRIALRPFSLNRLIEKHVSARPVAHYDRHAALRRAAAAVHRRLAPAWARGDAWEHPAFGLAHKHSSALFGGFTRDKAYRRDLARCLVALEHYPDACLAVDLDTCFLNDLTIHCADKAWACRWESQAFANPAVLYLPRRSWSAALVRKGKALESFLPWVLFADPLCDELGIQVHPAKLLDPLGDSASMLYGGPVNFFGARDNLALDLHALSTERHWAIRWHGHWTTAPADSSIYGGLLKACTDEERADS